MNAKNLHTLNGVINSERMPSVFISHSAKDRTFVESELLPLLNRHSISPWYSKDEITTASLWEKKIREGLTASEWFLVVLSKNAIVSEWVQAEVAWALENRKDRLIPVLIDNSVPSELNLRLIRYQHIDFVEDSNSARSRLLAVWGMKLQVDPALEIELSIRLGSSGTCERRKVLVFSVATIGRDPSADIYLDYPVVSREHAAFKVRQLEQKRSLWLVDLYSSNMTFINGTPISSPVEVTTHDVITLGGEVRIRVEGIKEIMPT